eukprot:COSAG01_NODE_55722_length_323_cov_0.741071_1_plen_42_part_01
MCATSPLPHLLSVVNPPGLFFKCAPFFTCVNVPLTPLFSLPP